MFSLLDFLPGHSSALLVSRKQELPAELTIHFPVGRAEIIFLCPMDFVLPLEPVFLLLQLLLISTFAAAVEEKPNSTTDQI